MNETQRLYEMIGPEIFRQVAKERENLSIFTCSENSHKLQYKCTPHYMILMGYQVEHWCVCHTCNRVYDYDVKQSRWIARRN